MSDDFIKAGAIRQSYDNIYGECNCSICELARHCDYEGRYQRLPRLTNSGALGLCPKLAGNERELKRLVAKAQKNQPDGVTSTAD